MIGEDMDQSEQLADLRAKLAAATERAEKESLEASRLRDLNGKIQNELDVAKQAVETWANRGDYWLQERQELIERTEKAEAERDALGAQNARLRAELKTFANNSLVGAIGREDYRILHEEIVDWFSASDFLRAAEVLNLTPPAALEEFRRRERSIGAEEELRRLAHCDNGERADIGPWCLDRADAIRDAREKGGAE